MARKVDFKKALRDTREGVDKTIRATALDMFKDIVLRTPVDTGRLRGNWQVSYGNPIKTETDTVDKSESGSVVMGLAANTLNRSNLNFETIWFSNNLPYAERIENGYSRQQPQGMVKVTILEYQPLLEKYARINKI